MASPIRCPARRTVANKSPLSAAPSTFRCCFFTWPNTECQFASQRISPTRQCVSVSGAHCLLLKPLLFLGRCICPGHGYFGHLQSSSVYMRCHRGTIACALGTGPNVLSRYFVSASAEAIVIELDDCICARHRTIQLAKFGSTRVSFSLGQAGRRQ